MHADPLIVFVPGLKPKPEPESHRDALFRCLAAGLRKADAQVADAFAATPRAFELVSWTFEFYGEHRDIGRDREDIERLLERDRASAADLAEATSWRRRGLRLMYRLADRFPFLIPRVADETLDVHLRDLKRYVRNDNDVGEAVRRHLKVSLRMAAASGRPVLLLAHSMGSVIAWDALWQLSRDTHYRGRIGLLMTLGSPLGQRYIQDRLLGCDQAGAARYPTVIDRWVNVAATGELTAIDMRLAADYGEMIDLGLVDSIEDVEVTNWYRDHGVLNVHAEYGYLANRDTARLVADWWREVTAD